MATMIKINGRFIVATPENIKRAMASKLPELVSANTSIDSDTAITIVWAESENNASDIVENSVIEEVNYQTEEPVEAAAETLVQKYIRVVGKRPAPAYLNNEEQLNKIINEKLSQKI